MRALERVILALAPGLAAARARSRALALHYEAAAVTDRTAHWHARGSDADAAAARRGRLAAVARDMIRNSPIAARVQQVVANNVVGEGILPRFVVPESLAAPIAARLRTQALQLIERHLDTTAIDADGRQNLYGLQRLVMNAVVDSGEALVVRVRPPLEPGVSAAPPLKLRVLEADYLDSSRDGPAETGGGWLREGIEYDADGRRVAYWLFDEHPGAALVRPGASAVSRRWPASDVLHVFRQDRPGQMRGVSWLAPVALQLQDLAEFQDAQLVRQKIAACFVAFRRAAPAGTAQAMRDAEALAELKPGAIMSIADEEDVQFGNPPDAGDFDPFVRSVLRSVAAGLGVTYEALSGDLSSVNFSSARMGRVEMDRNVASWQWTMLIPGLLQPLGRWVIEAWATLSPGDARVLSECRFDWVPPLRVLVDPAREIPALRDAVRAGFASRSGVVRQLGHDPERLAAEIEADNADADARGLVFESDYRNARGELPAPAADDEGQSGAAVRNDGEARRAVN